MYPTTIVDLNEMQVRQTHPYNSYNVIRTEYLKQPQVNFYPHSIQI